MQALLSTLGSNHICKCRGGACQFSSFVRVGSSGGKGIAERGAQKADWHWLPGRLCRRHRCPGLASSSATACLREALLST